MNAREQLKGWRQALAPLVDELALALLPWVERLALAVGPLAEAAPEPDGDPDGFAGLGRRGSYERLLPTEWLLATEAPDEFVRRAAAGEHAFFELARRREAGSRVSAVFFDAGPAQLGAPRLAHLALLLLFERRAQLGSARFFWGVVQKPGMLREAVTPEQGQMLLEGRSRVDLEAPLVTLLTEQKELRGAGRELWLVGGPRVRALAPGPFLEVVEPLEREPTRLLVRVRRPDRVEVEIELPLPSPDVQLRMLRDPFVRAAPPPRKRATSGPRRWAFPRVDGEGALFFGSSGRRLLVELEGGLAAYPIPNSPHAQPAGEPMLYAAAGGHHVLGACWEKNRATLLIEAPDGSLAMQAIGRRGGPSGPSTPVTRTWTRDESELGGLRQGESTRPGDNPGARPATLVMHPIYNSSRYIVRSPAGHWGELASRRSEQGEDRWSYDCKGGDAVALETVNLSVLLARWSREDTIPPTGAAPAGPEIRSLHSIEIQDVNPDGSLGKPRLESRGERVVFGYAEPGSQHAKIGLCAVERPTEGDWEVYCRHEGTSYFPLIAPRTGTVVGVHHGVGNMPSLVVLDEDRMRLFLSGPAGEVTLATSKSRIVKVAVCTTRQLFAYLCEDGRLVALSPAYDHPLLQEHHDAD